MGLEARLLHKLQERRFDRLMQRYGGIQTCPWCRQCAQSSGDWSFTEWEGNPFHDVLTCGVCGGTSVWHFAVGMIAIGPLDPPKPLAGFPNNTERDRVTLKESSE